MCVEKNWRWRMRKSMRHRHQKKMIAMHEIKALSAQCSRERCPLGHAKAYRCLIAMKIRPERILQETRRQHRMKRRAAKKTRVSV